MDTRDFPLIDGADDIGSGLLGLGPACDDAQEPGGLPLPEPDGVRPASHGDGPRVGGSDSDSEDDDGWTVAAVGANQSGHDLGPPPPWDYVSVEEEATGEGEEGEVVVVSGRLEDRAVLSSMVGADEDSGSVSGSRSSQEEEEEEDEWSDLEYSDTLGTLIRFVLGRGEWNVADTDAEFYRDDDYEDSDHEILVGQFIDQDRMGSTPAAKSVVERLPVILITEEDAAHKNTVCAVCKDEISLAEMARRLPCLHIYHGDCILPWLEMRNTCPVCRYELPTKDPDPVHEH